MVYISFYNNIIGSECIRDEVFIIRSKLDIIPLLFLFLQHKLSEMDVSRLIQDLALVSHFKLHQKFNIFVLRIFLKT